MSERLPTHLEVTAIIRRAAASGGFAAVVKKGDPERGSLLLMVSSRGRHMAFLERILSVSGAYRWAPAGPSESASSDEVRDFVSRRARFDEDLWAIELDIADPERFIAETIGSP
ncbi:MAG TPA: DUF1491 family protein [Sphingomicrobium sp.]|nr:DUF1491 family protein [Sphingomicrobium sp.]